MVVTLPTHLEELLGLNVCSLSAWTLGPYFTFLALFASVFVRYRGVVFFKYYTKRNTHPTRYCTVTALPYEAIAAFVFLAIPRIMWVKNVFVDAVAEGAWEARDLDSPWSWALVAYFLLIDIYERVMFQRKILTPYHKLKAQRTLDVLVVDEVPAAEKETFSTPADEEAATAPPLVAEAAPEPRPTFQDRLRKIFTLTYPEPTAVNVLSQYHMMAFLKAIFVFIFLSNSALAVCTGASPLSELFDLTQSFVVPFTLVSSWMSLRFIGLVVRGARFAKQEVDFAAVNGREGQLSL